MRKHLWIEAARTLAMFIVVGWHSVHFMARTQGPIRDWLDGLAAITTAAVPMFFIVSGYLAQRSSFIARSSWAEYLRGRVLPIALSFFAWNVLYAIFFRLLWEWPLLRGKTLWYLFTGYIHLWFVFVLLQLMLLHKTLLPRLGGRGATRVFAAAVAIALGWYAFSSGLLWVQGDDGHFFEWHWGKLCLGWAGFYFWGVFLGADPERLARLDRKFVLLTICAALSLALCWFRLDRESDVFGNYVRHYFLLAELPFQFIAPTWLLVVMRRLDLRGGNGVRLLGVQGRDTFGIYLLHIMPLYLLYKLWAAPELPMNPWLSLLPALGTWIICTLCLRWSQTPALSKVNAGLFCGR